MATTKIRYVGLKEHETAFKHLTGVSWAAGQVQDIDTKHADTLLKHPDVFAIDEDAPKPDITDNGTDTQWATAPDGTYLLLSDMTKEQLHACAKQYGVEVHPNCGAGKIIEVLQNAFTVKA